MSMLIACMCIIAEQSYRDMFHKTTEVDTCNIA